MPGSTPSFNEAAVAAFYSGKTVRLLVGYEPGSGYDLTARLVAKYLPNHLPGRPQVIVENMEGAASKAAANFLFAQAPKDGLVIGTINPQLATDQLIGADGVQYDVTKFAWLGSAFNSTDVCALHTDAPAKSFQEIVNSPEAIKIGASAPGDNTWTTPTILKAATGANFQVISGYQGTNDLRIAVERGEIQGLCQSFESLSTTPQYQNNQVRVVVQNTARPHALLPEVPLAESFAQSEESKQLLAVLRVPREIEKPFLTPPGVPNDRVSALRAAFAATFADPAFREEAQTGNVDLDPKDARGVEEGLRQVMATPPQVIQRLKEILQS